MLLAGAAGVVTVVDAAGTVVVVVAVGGGFWTVRSLFTEQADAEEYARPAPESFGKFTTYCGT